MARFKDFGSPEDSKAENLTFKIHDEEFTCYPAMPGKILLNFVQRSTSDDVTAQTEAITLFFQKVLLPESYERFDALAIDPVRVVTMDTLTKIVSWIMEEYSGRPTEGSEHSPNGE